MAKSNSPLFSLSAHGSFAKTLEYQKNQSGTTIRSKVTPPDPRTASQQVARALHGLLQDTWKSAPSEWQMTWRIILDRRPLTPGTLFIGRNIRNLTGQTDLNQFDMMGSKGTLSPPTGVILQTMGGLIGVQTDDPILPIGFTLSFVVAAAVTMVNPSIATLLPIVQSFDTSVPIAFTFTGPAGGPPWLVQVWNVATNPRGETNISPHTSGTILDPV